MSIKIGQIKKKIKQNIAAVAGEIKMDEKRLASLCT